MQKKNRGRRTNKKTSTLNCERATKLILDYLSGELDRKTVREFEEHLAECPDCVSFLNTYRGTVRAARALRFEEMPPRMQERVQAFLARKLARSRCG